MRARVLLLAALVGGPLWPGPAGAAVRLPSTEAVSVTSDEQWGTGDNTGAFVSDDGRYVAFTNDLGGLGHPGWGPYVRDRVAGTTTSIDVPPGWSVVVGLSGDGRILAARTQLLAGGHAMVLHDLTTGASTMYPDVEGVALAGAGCHALGSNADGYAVVVDRCGGGTTTLGPLDSERGGDISADGRWVAYAEPGGPLVVVDVSTGTRRVIAPSGGLPSLSADGRMLAYEVWTPARVDVHVANLATGTTLRYWGDEPGPFPHAHPVLDPTGRWLVYADRDSTLRAVELATWRTELVSTPLAVVEDGGQRPDVSPGAAYVAFESSSPLLVPGDTNLDQYGFGENRGLDVFLRTRGQITPA